MSSANPPLPFPQNPALATPPPFWRRQSAPLKQGIKTGLAGTITYAVYAGWHLPQGYWAVFAALVVTQANLGASWKAALYRTIGSTCGALAAALIMPLLGDGPARAGVALFLLATLFGYLTSLHPAFSAGGFTAALILVFGGQGEPWHLAWLRVLYTIVGAFIAFAVGALIWPVQARASLRYKIASILDGAGALYRAITAASLQGIDNQQQVRQLDRRLHDLRRGITQQIDEARSELAFSHFNRGAYQAFLDLADQVRRRLTAMAADSSLYVSAQLQPKLVPSLPALVEKTSATLVLLAEAVRKPAETWKPTDLDADLSKQGDLRAATSFALDRMLPFWALVFNLREVAQDLKQLESTLPDLA
jgi:uncharacterized membrane protein YccC